MNKTLYILLGVLGLSIAITSFLKSWNTKVLYAFLGIIGGYTVFLIVLNIFAKKQTKVNQNKYKLPWCWNRSNMLLRDMPSGDSLEWHEGLNRRVETKKIKVGNEYKTYVGFYGTLAARKIIAVVIYCIEDDNIARYDTTNDPSILADPFSEFEPAKQEFSGYNPYGYSPYSKRKGVKLSFPQRTPDFPDNVVDAAFNMKNERKEQKSSDN